jgi:hypothetical protein
MLGMKLGKLVDKRLQDVVSRMMTEALPLKTAFKLKGITKKINEALDNHEELRRASLMKHGKKQEDGSLALDDVGNVIFEQGNIHAFMNDMSDLADTDVEIPKLRVDELGEDLKLSVEEIDLIEDLLEF